MRRQKKIPVKSALLIVVLLCVLLFGLKQNAYAAETGNNPTATEGDGWSISGDDFGGNLSGNLRILITLTLISLAPSILIMLTSFTRIIVVLNFTRTAIGTQTAPSNQILIGLALFLTWFIMAPTFTEINNNAIKPLDANEITQEEALERAVAPLREFMWSQAKVEDVRLFMDIAGVKQDLVEDKDDIGLNILVPGFILGELRSAFIIGFMIYIPFIVLDMVVASVLMSMGMMMLPPTTISLPFKILLFVLVDGWNLIIMNLVRTF